MSRCVSFVSFLLFVSTALTACSESEEAGSASTETNVQGSGSQDTSADTESAIRTDSGGTEPQETDSGTEPAIGSIDVAVIDAGATLVSAVFFDRPTITEGYRVAAEDGDCKLYLPVDAACNPPCGSTEICNPENTCVVAPRLISAGVITVEGPKSSAVLEPTAFGYDAARLSAGDVAEGGLIRANAAGGEIAAFQGEVEGLAPPVFDSFASLVTLTKGQETTITWQPVAEGTVEVSLNTGWHGAPPEASIRCEVSASAGRVVISKAVIEGFPKSAPTGLFQVPSSLSLLRRSQIETSMGAVDLVARHQLNVAVIHE